MPNIISPITNVGTNIISKFTTSSAIGGELKVVGDTLKKTGNDSLGEDLKSTGKSLEVNKKIKDHFFASSVQKANVDDVKKIVSDMYNRTIRRRTIPPSYWDYPMYEHRKNTTEDLDGMFRIGDSVFVIPPEFITVQSISGVKSIQAIRQEGSLKQGHGYTNREIIVSVMLNGIDQINGYRVKSPMDYYYYVDGLRSLIAQFKCTPFLPVQNIHLNVVNNIHTVAFRSMLVNTVPGFPDLLEVKLVLQEFNATPYIEADTMFFDDFVDWDLFRYFYQRMLFDDSKHPSKILKYDYTKTDVKDFFELSILKTSAITEYKDKNGTEALEFDVFKDENYVKMISNSDNITISEITFNMSNILPTITMSGHEIPTMQYLGGTDLQYSISFETYDEDVVTKFNEFYTQNQMITREYRDLAGVGFVKINNGLIGITGTTLLLINRMNVSTVPNFPGLYTIGLECISYDSLQKEKEKFYGMKPFDGEMNGTKDDLITQDFKGLRNKIRQDLCIEQKMLDMELYPDLHLPKYSEIDEAIKRILIFRSINDCQETLGYSELPRDDSFIPFKGYDQKYDRYVDPDFYMFYPTSYSDIDTSKNGPIDNNFKFPNVKSDKVIEPKYIPGNEPDANIKNDLASSVDVSGVDYNTGNKFVDLMLSKEKEGCGYVWGAKGEVLTAFNLSTFKNNFPTGDYTGVEKWFNRQVFDCSGFVWWGMNAVGIKADRGTADNLVQNYCTIINKSIAKPGDLCWRKGQHIAVFIGDGKTVEAMDNSNGVTIGKVSSDYTFARINGLNNEKIDPLMKPVGPISPLSSKGIFDNSQSSSPKLGKFNVPELDQYDDIIIRESELKGLDPNFIKAIIKIESSGNRYAVNPNGSCKGLMQINEQYHANGRNLFDPNTNIEIGCRIWLDYGQGSNYQKEYWLAAYNWGPGNVQQWQEGNKTPPEKTLNYIKKYDEFYAELMRNGGSAGNTLTPNKSNAAVDTKFRININYDSTKNPTEGKEYSNETKINPLLFGRPFRAESPVNDLYKGRGLATARCSNAYLEPKEDEYVEAMFTDMVEFNKRGRLVRAFPSFVFMVCDEGGDWINADKMWTNFYVYKSVIDIEIFRARDNPVDVAEVLVTNYRENLTRAVSTGSLKKKIDNDPDYNILTKFIYNQSGILISKKITSGMIKEKNKLYDHCRLYEGLRIHIRLGYGSNPLTYPVSFNGHVVQIEYGDTISMVAQSDGAELISRTFGSKESSTVKIVENIKEPSNIIASMLTKRENVFWNTLNSKWTEASLNGIEHFGLHCNEVVDIKDKKSILSTVTDFVDGKMIVDTLNRLDVGHNDDYDIIKNIYIGNYYGRNLFSGTGPSLFFDGERDLDFFVYGRTCWDIGKMAEKVLPDFIFAPMYHQFDSRIFYGVGHWNAKFRYNIEGEDNEIVEYSKPFSQCHVLTSFNSIINNQMKINTKKLVKNMIGAYSLNNEDINTTPVIRSDKSIDWSQQNTETIDTSMRQNTLMPWFAEKMIEWAGWDTGKQNAIGVCVSELQNRWEESYEGSIVILGDPAIKPFDMIYIDDSYNHMKGAATVKEVHHSFSSETGFISVIYPGLIANNTLKNSGRINVARTVCLAGSTISGIMLSRFVSIKSIAPYKKAISLIKTSKGINKAVNFLKDTKYGGKVHEFVSSGKIIDKGKDFFEWTKNTVNLIDKLDDANKFYKTLKVAKTTISATVGFAGNFVCPVLGEIVATAIINTMLDVALTTVIDMFAYNNCITLSPLYIKDKPFVGGVRGANNIIPGTDDAESYNSQ